MKIWVRFEVQWTVTYDVTQVEFEEDISIVFYLMRSDTHASFVPLVNGTCERALVHLTGPCDWLFIFVRHTTVFVDGNVRCVNYDKKIVKLSVYKIYLIWKVVKRGLMKNYANKVKPCRKQSDDFPNHNNAFHRDLRKSVKKLVMLWNDLKTVLRLGVLLGTLSQVLHNDITTKSVCE